MSGWMENTNSWPARGQSGSGRRRPTTAATTDVPTLRQCFYYGTRAIAPRHVEGEGGEAADGLSSASPQAPLTATAGTETASESLLQTARQLQQEGEQEQPPPQDEVGLAKGNDNNNNNDTKVSFSSGAARIDFGTRSLGGTIGSSSTGGAAANANAADGDDGATEERVSPAVYARLHSFFQRDVIMPYTFREKTMHQANLGWLPRDKMLEGSGGSRSRRAEIGGKNRSLVNLQATHSRPPHRKEWPPLYEAPDGSNRYRRIEDLALFVRTGTITPETNYFRDPMQRRLHEEVIFIPPQQKIIQSEDPRQDRVWTDEGKKNRAQAKLQSIIPKRAQLCKLKHDHSTGLVKPYALGKSAHVASAKPFSEFAVESAMESYVTTMQCQRPSKGLRGPMLDD